VSIPVKSPPVYRPQQMKNPCAQRKPHGNPSLETRPAPPVYRPGQPSARALQTKTASNFKLEKRPAPPVYRPQQQIGGSATQAKGSTVAQPGSLSYGAAGVRMVQKHTAPNLILGSLRKPAGTPTRPGAIQRMLGFGHLKEPTGYGSVSLSATLNGVDIGKAWSRQTTYSSGTEHAEDALVDLIEAGELAAEYGLVDEDAKKVAELLKNGKVLVINNLTASPCSTKRGTCTKDDLKGCTERLIELANRGYTIAVNAEHYYQPKGVDEAKAKSIAACKDMVNAGIKVKVAN